MARADEYRRNNRRQIESYGYIDGNTVRKPQEYARPVPQRQRRQAQRREVSQRTRRNRARVLQMNLGYVAFLTVASIATLFVCVNFLQLQAENTTLRNNVAAAQSQLNDLRVENDTAYENALTSVDLQAIRDIAINKLGMVYADEGQIRTYDSNNGDYVRQYENVPEK